MYFQCKLRKECSLIIFSISMSQETEVNEESPEQNIP